MADALRQVRSPGAPSTAGDSIELAGSSPVIGRVHELLRRSALGDSNVLIVAERGVDAAAVARELHNLGSASAPWIALECGTGDAASIERAIFGAPRVLSTEIESVSADSRLAAARGGTLYVQDVGELPAAAQARLARVARDGEVRIDGTVVSTGMRLVASAAPGIDDDVRENRFRADLYRRLAVTRIDLPSLRERLVDIPVLAARLLDELSTATELAPRSFTQAALALLSALHWPGNLAELRSVVERVLAENAGDTIQIEQLLPALQLDRASTASFVPAGSLRDARLRFERDYIASVLQHHGWRMAEAAQTLGIQRPNLYRKARQLGIPLARATE
jgi:DNA-binding NtrC family response regulator